MNYLARADGKRALGLDFELIEGRVAALDSFPPFESLPAFDWDARPMMGVPAHQLLLAMA